MKFRELLKLSVAAFSVLFVLILASCAPIQLIAPYDERIENGITELQKSTTTFFVKIERQGGSDKRDYKNYVKFYDDAKVSTKSLLIRAGATAQNKMTEEQISLLIKKYKSLEDQHKTIGISPYTIPVLESSFDQIFRTILTLEVAKKEEKKSNEK
jgi:hypothetical protein